MGRHGSIKKTTQKFADLRGAWVSVIYVTSPTTNLSILSELFMLCSRSYTWARRPAWRVVGDETDWQMPSMDKGRIWSRTWKGRALSHGTTQPHHGNRSKRFDLARLSTFCRSTQTGKRTRRKRNAKNTADAAEHFGIWESFSSARPQMFITTW